MFGSHNPYSIGAWCPKRSLVPGRSLFIGEAVARLVLPQVRLRSTGQPGPIHIVE